NNPSGALSAAAADALGGITDTVVAAVNYTLTAFVENLTLSGTAVTGFGNELDNVITGNAQSNSLNGMDGADTLIGGAGNDSLVGGNGIDTASYANATSGVTVNLALASPQTTGGSGL